MKIISYKKINKSNYEIKLDNGETLTLHEELILKSSILMKKEISKTEKKALESENEYYLSLDIAIKKLARQAMSTYDLKEFLKKKEVDLNHIDQITKDLTKQGFLNDAKYSDAFARDKLLLTSDGPYKVKRNLLDKGIDESLADKSIEIFDKEVQEERILKLQEKYLRRKSSKSTYELRNSLYNYLSNLGYEKSIVISLLDLSSYDESPAREKEYEKQHRRLSRRYEGKDLENRIKQNLYRKGFK